LIRIDFSNVDIDEYLDTVKELGEFARQNDLKREFKLFKEAWIAAKDYKDRNAAPWNP